MGTAVIYREAPYQVKIPKRISIETFLLKYRKGGPGVKYEFNNGIIEKSSAMRLSEHYIIANLLAVFQKTPAFAQRSHLTSELEVWTSETQWRKPDLSLVTIEQTRAAMDGFEPVPEFVIEVVSPNDKINQIQEKIKEYFAAGVKIIWLIFPHSQNVYIYRNLSQHIEECSGDQICSAEPIVEGFKMKAADIFKRP
ncbi:MAG: Uma2 family endonuclease [Saprospiraceae bacterium]|nr:Uma2 family endonuclease [Saprospiraceae bacterium]